MTNRQKLAIIECIEKDYIINCSTQEQADIYAECMSELKKHWADGDGYIGNTKWYVNEEKTLYRPKMGQYGATGRICSSFVVVKFEDILEDKSVKIEL